MKIPEAYQTIEEEYEDVVHGLSDLSEDIYSCSLAANKAAVERSTTGITRAVKRLLKLRRRLWDRGKEIKESRQ